MIVGDTRLRRSGLGHDWGMSLRFLSALRIPVWATLLAAPLLAWSQAFHFVALGDLPYGAPDKAGPPYRALIDVINREKPAFSIHVGDFKSGGSQCSDEEFERQLGHFNLFEAALVYTPGDNEWTDCHRSSNGSHDPLERLQALRRLFFKPTQSLGQRPVALESQASRMPAHFKYVENQRWMHEGVMFATVHIVGSNNNLDRRRPQTRAEHEERDRANIAWIQDSFAQAKVRKAKALVLAMQANPLGFLNLSGSISPESGFHASVGQTLLPLARDAAFPVLLVHGDTHTFRFDMPYWLQGETVRNLQRLEVPGESDVRAVRVDVDLARAPPFSVRLLAAE